MKATVEKMGLSTNGNRIYHYNFIDDNGVNYNELFKHYGRLTIKGISNNNAPFEMIEWFKNIGSQNFRGSKVFDELTKTQNKIAKIKKSGGDLESIAKIHETKINDLKIHNDFLQYVIDNGFQEIEK